MLHSNPYSTGERDSERPLTGERDLQTADLADCYLTNSKDKSTTVCANLIRNCKCILLALLCPETGARGMHPADRYYYMSMLSAHLTRGS